MGDTLRGFCVLYPLKVTGRPLFESIMPLTLTFCAVVFSNLYFRKVDNGLLREGIKLGILWFVMGIVFDLFMFTRGPMKMSFLNYMMDIGITYLIFPIVTIGRGYFIDQRQVKLERKHLISMGYDPDRLSI